MLRIMAGEKAALLKLDEDVDLTKMKFFYQESDGGGRLISAVDPDLRDVKRIRVVII